MFLIREMVTTEEICWCKSPQLLSGHALVSSFTQPCKTVCANCKKKKTRLVFFLRMSAGDTIVVFVMFQVQKQTLAFSRLEQEAWDFQQTGLQRRTRISNESRQPEPVCKCLTHHVRLHHFSFTWCPILPHLTSRPSNSLQNRARGWVVGCGFVTAWRARGSGGDVCVLGLVVV